MREQLNCQGVEPNAFIAKLDEQVWFSHATDAHDAIGLKWERWHRETVDCAHLLNIAESNTHTRVERSSIDESRQAACHQALAPICSKKNRHKEP